MSTPRSAWRLLKIEPTREISAIRSAYAAALKRIDPDSDRSGFEALREAREQALAFARNSESESADPPLADPRDITIPLATITGNALLAPARWDDGRTGDVAVLTTPRTDDPVFMPLERPGANEGEERIIPLRPMTLEPPLLVDAAAPPTLESASAGAPPSFDEHYRTILYILFGEDGQYVRMTGEVADILRGHVAALLRDGRLAEIAFYADAERWFSQIVARSIPRSDVILAMVVTHFGWLASRGRIDQSPDVATAVQRYDSLAFRDEVRRPQHRLFVAWNELTTPADEASHRSYDIGRKKINELLITIRRDYPDLEQELDWYRVSLWENPPPISSRMPSCAFFFAILVLFSTLSSLGNCSETRPASNYTPSVAYLSNELTSPEGDIAAMLDRSMGSALKFGTLAEKRPALAALLRTNWQKAKDSDLTKNDFIREMHDLLFQRFVTGLKRADHDLIAEYRMLELDRIRTAMESGSQGCARYYDDQQSPGPRSLEFNRRRNEVMARVLTEVDTDPPAKPFPTMFSMTSSVVDSAAKRAGLAPERFLAAMDESPTSGMSCKTRIALLETALALPPKKGLYLLRNM